MPQERFVSEDEQVKAEMEEARFRLGPVRIFPSVGVPSAGYNSNVFGTSTNPVSDWYVTVSAGVRFLVPLGSKMYLRLNAFPQYTWDANFSNRDNFGGIFGFSLLGFFNHVYLRLTGLDSERYRYYSSQFPGLALVRTQGAAGIIEYRISSRYSILGSGMVGRERYTQPGAPLEEQVAVKVNDRTDSAVRGGLRYHFSDEFDIGALVEETWSDFVYVPQTRDNRSTGYLLTLHYNKPRLYVNLTGGYREGRATNDSLFPPYSTPTGSFFVSYFLMRWLEIQAKGYRRVGYSVSTPSQPYYYDNRAGGGVNIQVAQAVWLRGFAQEGPIVYPRPESSAGGTFQRRDDLLQYGGGASIQLLGKWVLSALLAQNIYHSNVPGGRPNNYSFTMSLLVPVERPESLIP